MEKLMDAMCLYEKLINIAIENTNGEVKEPERDFEITLEEASVLIDRTLAYGFMSEYNL